MSKYVKVVCESNPLEDIQLETLRYDQVPRIAGVFPPLPSIGIEAEGYVHCKYYLVEERGNEVKESELGFIEIEGKLDEGKIYTTTKISEGLLGKLVDHLGKFL